ncbi:MAG: MmcQ/YjbR family DNA-binding protein [Bacteroidales bacterium]|jgi:predicted DNA-binding protein (MmcQ/YjbR family)|nr:MmcQ/YjbR family DNA-binding protein [Bacteroidales bacterium]
MNIETLREHCLAVKGAEECMPFGDDTLVYKIMGKMFAYFGLNPKDGNFVVSLKCHPERSAQLRERYSGITDPIHSAKTLKWNSVYIESDLPDEIIAQLVTHSAEEVIKALPKYKQKEYEAVTI